MNPDYNHMSPLCLTPPRELEYKSAYSPDKIHLTRKIKHDSVIVFYVPVSFTAACLYDTNALSRVQIPQPRAFIA